MIPRNEKNFYKKSEIKDLRPMTDQEYANFVKGLNLLDTAQKVEGKWYDYWMPVPNHTPANRGPDDIKGIVIHTTEGWRPSYYTFADPNRKASAHYGLERDGSVIYMVDEKDQAWHGGSGVNKWGIGIEVSGFSIHNGKSAVIGTPIGFGMTQINALAKLVANIAKRNNIPIDRNHIFGHAHTGSCFQGGNPANANKATPGNPNLEGEAGGGSCHHDPGNDFPWDRFIKLVKYYRYRNVYFALYGLGGSVALYFLYEYVVNERSPLEALQNIYNRVI